MSFRSFPYDTTSLFPSLRAQSVTAFIRAVVVVMAVSVVVPRVLQALREESVGRIAKKGHRMGEVARDKGEGVRESTQSVSHACSR